MNIILYKELKENSRVTQIYLSKSKELSSKPHVCVVTLTQKCNQRQSQDIQLPTVTHDRTRC